MNNLDFLSGPPNIFIFQKQSNKTTFGGVLFLIYIIIMIGITFIYIMDYIYNEKYTIEYSSYLNADDKTSSNPFAYLDIYNESYSENNPIINISFNLFKTNESYTINLSDRFVILDAFNNFAELKRDTIYQRKVSEFGFIIVYMCEDIDCMLNEDDSSTFDYYVEIKYNGFDLNHQEDIPLKNNASKLFHNFYLFSFNSALIKLLNWEIVKYKEIKGISRLFDMLLDNQNEYTGGYISSSECTFINHPIINQRYIPGKLTKVLGEFLMTTGQRQYTEYKRRKISLLDVVANIGALFMTLYSCFIFTFKYYSKNYDNYEIIQTIINKKLNVNVTKKNNITELNEFSKDSNNELIINKNNTDSLINNKNNFCINDDEDLDDIKLNKDKNIKKLSFAHFFFNNIYCKNCNKFYEQEIIRICNETMSNYLSVESILYNQIMLENLFKDYSWNNRELNNIDNNEFIIKLKKMI